MCGDLSGAAVNRTDRLLAIVLELQGKRKQRADDLAATFETSKRTIYRDIQALCEAGVPIISMPGQGYTLMEGYFLPPLRFSIDEATMLLLGSDVMTQNFDADYREAAQSAARKIAGVLPENTRKDVDYLRDSIRIITAGTWTTATEAGYLQQLRRAILKSQTVRFGYQARQGEQETRSADPYGLIQVNGVWQLSAYCHTRQAMRIFRLSRMADLVLLDQTYNRAERIEAWRSSMAEHMPGSTERDLIVRVLFDAEAARWVQEDYFFFITSRETTPDGLLVTLAARHERDVLQWLLGWGRHVRILEPDSVRALLAHEAQAMLTHFQNQ